MITKLYKNEFNVIIEEDLKLEIRRVDGWIFEILGSTFGLHYYNRNWKITELDTGYELYKNRDKSTAILTAINRVFGKAEFNPLYVKTKKEILKDLEINDIQLPVNKYR